MKNKVDIFIADDSFAEKLQKDLFILGFSRCTIFSSIESILKKSVTTTPDLFILELKGDSESSFINAKTKIQKHYISSFPILFLADEKISKKLVGKGLIKNSDYISYSYTIRELELCLESLMRADSETESKHVWLDPLGLQTLFNLLPNGIIVSDEFGKILEVNNTLVDILGYSYDEFCTMHIKDIAPKENHSIIEKNIKTILKGETLSSEVVNFCKDGTKKYFEVIETRILLSIGRYGLLIISTDITRKKEINEAILESEEKYRILVEKSNDGIIFAQDGKLIYGNPRIMQMVGVSPNEFIGQPIEKYLHSSEINRVKNYYKKRLIGDNVPEIYETIVQRQNGESLPVEFNVNMTSFRGKPITILFIRDISSRKLAEKYLKESEESYRSVFDNASEAIYIQDSNGVFLDVNKAATAMYGYSKNELIGKTPEMLSADGKNDLNDVARRLKAAFEGKSQYFEFWGKTKYGREFPKEVFLSKGRYFGADVVFAMAHDISNRKNAEEILIESEEKYRTLAEQIPVGIYRTSEDGKIFYANPAIVQIFGYDSVDELLTKNVNEFYLNPNEREEDLNSMRDSNGYIQRELKLKRKDGKSIWVRDNGKATFDDQGKLIFFDGVIENITEQKEATEALEESESSLKVMLNAIPDLLFKINREGIYLDFYSPRIEDIQISKERIIGHSIQEFFDPNYSQQIFSAINRCLATSTPQTIEYTTLMDGNLNYYEARIVPASDNEVLSLARNITSRKKDEEKINMLALTIMNIIECISITDSEDRLIFVNPALLKTYGYKEEELLGQKISILRSPKVTDEISNKIMEGTLSGGWQGEITNIRKDGSEFPISLSTAVVKDNNNQPIAFVGVATDITDRKKAESELVKAKEQAEESDRLKTAFLANMSHEIRSPMNAILGFIRILRDEEKLSENGKQYIDLISSSGTQLISVIEDILDTSKIQANQLRLSIHEFDLNALFVDLYTIFSEQVKAKSQMSTLLLNPILQNPSPFYINSDDLRIRQIFTNLLSNAVKFTPKGVIEFGYSIIIDDENPQIKFFVKDTGIGLAQDKLSLIFERFRQADDSYTRLYGGSGLGLAISKGLVELLGGKIWVESKEGKGSTFYFTLPLKTMIADGSAKSKNDDNLDEVEINRIDGLNWTGKTIFIVEDMKDIMYFLKKVLTKTGAKLIFAENLAEAKEVFSRGEKIDLILLDVRLPDGDGYTLSAEFKAKKPEIPIIAQTAYAMQGEKEKSAFYGCDDFISKPIDADLLYFKIDNLFKRIG